MGESSEEVRVRDLLRSGDLQPRSVLGQQTCIRLGARAWERPNVAISGRLYKKYGVEDPWDPNSDHRGRSIGLGPVGLRLTEPRRQVAPHLRPKAPKKKRKKPQAVDPLARWRKNPSAEARAKSQPRVPEVSRQNPEPTRMFEGPTRHGLRGKLPVRPDIARSESTKTTRSSRSEPGSEPGLENRLAPRPPGPASSPRVHSGSARVRMRGRHVKNEAPQVIGGKAEPAPVVRESPPPEPEPVARKVPKTGLGMDDLFGAAADAGRLRIRRNHKTEAGKPESEES